MPGWILSLLKFFAPTVVKWALALLEKQYPGIQALIETIISYIDGHPNPTQAMINLHESVALVANPPELVKG